MSLVCQPVSEYEGYGFMRTLLEHHLATGQILRVGQGDITAETTEAIVNAANEYLEHGGGVAGAIVRRGGESIQEESRRWIQENGIVRTGTAALTGAGTLPARFVIHAVGPIWGRGDDEVLLASAVRSALTLADQHKIRSVSIPGISSGIFGGPKDICARVIIQTVVDYLAEHATTSLKEVHFCNIDDQTVAAFMREARQILEGKL
jgi:O-acetyl-ADP-ribose deacetylase (regulator of RNase III)